MTGGMKAKGGQLLTVAKSSLLLIAFTAMVLLIIRLVWVGIPSLSSPGGFERWVAEEEMSCLYYAVAEYKETLGRYPDDLQQLVEAGLVGNAEVSNIVVTGICPGIWAYYRQSSPAVKKGEALGPRFRMRTKSDLPVARVILVLGTNILVESSVLGPKLSMYGTGVQVVDESRFQSEFAEMYGIKTEE